MPPLVYYFGQASIHGFGHYCAWSAKMYVCWKVIGNTVESYSCIDLGEEKYGHGLVDIFSMIRFRQQCFRGYVYKELRTRIDTEKTTKFLSNREITNIHPKISSFRQRNHLVEKYQVHRSIQLFEMGFVPFSCVTKDVIVKKWRPKQFWYRILVSPCYISSPFFLQSCVYSSIDHVFYWRQLMMAQFLTTILFLHNLASKSISDAFLRYHRSIPVEIWGREFCIPTKPTHTPTKRRPQQNAENQCTCVANV